MQRKLEIAVLGNPQVLLDGQPVADQLQAKYLALLVYLAASGQPHTRHALAGLLWGDTPDDNAKNSLRVALASLRKLIPDHILVTHQTVAFNSKLPHWLDIADVQARTERLETANADSLRPLLPLYRDAFLHDFYIENAPEWEEWVGAQRAYWERRALQGFERLTDHLLEGRDYAGASVVLLRRVQIDPWQEHAHRQLMQCLSRSGDFTAALAYYERLRRRLDEELGEEPMPETTVLAERIQAARRTPPRPLPLETGAFVGRAAELDRLRRLLLDPTCRLVTIVGLGGMGKTRLALEVARAIGQARALEFLNGVAWIPLAGVASVESLPQAIAEALEAPLIGRADTTAELLHYLRHKELLLVLDNVEHLLPGSVGLLRRIIDHCPAVKLLVTSREPLLLEAEWRLDLEGLDYAGDEHAPLTDQGAVQLLIRAARQVRPDMMLNGQDAPHIRRLCRVVAGMPLALKLAASWLRVMSIERIVAEVEQGLDLLTTRLHDVPERQRSMRAMFDATWALLDADEQRTMAALSVFRGGFTQQAAQTIAGTTPPLLANLIDRSLVMARQASFGTRYELHELVRHYAAERLAAAGAQAAVVERHSAYYLRLLAGQEAALYGAARPLAMATLRRDLENVQQAWQSAFDSARLTAIQPSAEALAAFYEFAGLFDDGKQAFAQGYDRLEAARQHDAEGAAGPLRRHLLALTIRFTFLLGQYEEARQRTDALLTMARAAEDAPRIADAYAFMGHLGTHDGAKDQARAYVEEAVSRYRALNESRRIIPALMRLALVVMNGDIRKLDQGIALCEEGMAIARAAGNVSGLANMTSQLAMTYSYARRPKQAEPYFQEALTLFEALGDLQGLSGTLNDIGYNYNILGQHQQALVYLEQSLTYSRQLAGRLFGISTHDELAYAYFELGQHDQAQRHWRLTLDLSRELGYQGAQSQALIGLGRVALAQGHYRQARELLEQALALAQELNHTLYSAQAGGYLGLLHDALGDPAAALRLLDASLVALHNSGGRHHFGAFLIEKAAILWEQGRAEAAQAMVAEAVEALSTFGNQLLLDKARSLFRIRNIKSIPAP